MIDFGFFLDSLRKSRKNVERTPFVFFCFMKTMEHNGKPRRMFSRFV